MNFFGLFRICDICLKPCKMIDVCEELGYNPGVDGHFYDSYESADSALNLLMDANNHHENFYDDVFIYEFSIFA